MSNRLPRYVGKRVARNGRIKYRFNPPAKVIKAGVAVRQELGNDIRRARPLAAALTIPIDAWMEEQSRIEDLGADGTVQDVFDYYRMSRDFNRLRDETQHDYSYMMDRIVKDIGKLRWSSINPIRARHIYDRWTSTGVGHANHALSYTSIAFNHAVYMGRMLLNPFTKVRRKSTPRRRVVWPHQDVVTFLDYAYSHFKYRSVGIIVQMAYEWCQRVGDMRELTWEDVDLDKRMVTVNQSKRSAVVYLPISDEMYGVLMQQKEDLGFQSYVAPSPRPVGGSYVPYTKGSLRSASKRIQRATGIPLELQLLDLRRTGVTQMVENGADVASIMQVTGHSSPASVTPYMTNTYKGACTALELRNTKSLTKE
jgi:integrase